MQIGERARLPTKFVMLIMMKNVSVQRCFFCWASIDDDDDSFTCSL